MRSAASSVGVSTSMRLLVTSTKHFTAHSPTPCTALSLSQVGEHFRHRMATPDYIDVHSFLTTAAPHRWLTLKRRWQFQRRRGMNSWRLNKIFGQTKGPTWQRFVPAIKALVWKLREREADWQAIGRGLEKVGFPAICQGLVRIVALIQTLCIPCKRHWAARVSDDCSAWKNSKTAGNIFWTYIKELTHKL